MPDALFGAQWTAIATQRMIEEEAKRWRRSFLIEAVIAVAAVSLLPVLAYGGQQRMVLGLLEFVVKIVVVLAIGGGAFAYSKKDAATLAAEVAKKGEAERKRLQDEGIDLHAVTLARIRRDKVRNVARLVSYPLLLIAGFWIASTAPGM